MVVARSSSAEVAEWQTRRSQKPMSARTCGFDSRSRHQIELVPVKPSALRLPRKNHCQVDCQANATRLGEHRSGAGRWPHSRRPFSAAVRKSQSLTRIAGGQPARVTPYSSAAVVGVVAYIHSLGGHGHSTITLTLDTDSHVIPAMHGDAGRRLNLLFDQEVDSAEAPA
jgi:hypothetical protein